MEKEGLIKSEKAKRAIQNVEMFYNAQNNIIKLFDDYTCI